MPNLQAAEAHRQSHLPHKIPEPASALGFRRARVGERVGEGETSEWHLYPLWRGRRAAICPDRWLESRRRRGRDVDMPWS